MEVGEVDVIEVRKLANIVRVTQEMIDDNPWTLERLLHAARMASIQRARRLAEETYWQNDDGLDNPCIVRAEN